MPTITLSHDMKAGTYPVAVTPGPDPEPPDPGPGPDPEPEPHPPEPVAVDHVFQWGVSGDYITQNFRCEGMAVFRLDVPHNAPLCGPSPDDQGRFTVTEAEPPPCTRTIYVTLIAGDIANPISTSGGMTANMNYGVGIPTVTGQSVGVAPGTSYYFNVTNYACTPGQRQNILTYCQAQKPS